MSFYDVPRLLKRGFLIKPLNRRKSTISGVVVEAGGIAPKKEKTVPSAGKVMARLDCLEKIQNN